MYAKITYMLVFVSILAIEIAYSQQTPPKKDSTQIYKNIETYSKTNRLTKFIYSLIFKPTPKKAPKRKVVKKKLITTKYKSYEGRIIRNINITTLDPFGYSIADTMVRAQNVLTKAGNRVHVKSQNITIRNLLLIRQNQEFDSLLVKESERLVRTMNYVNSVSFVVRPTAKNSDSVDIFIRELDNWSILPNATANSSVITVNLTDRNFLGLGHESQNGFSWYPVNKNNAYNTNYYIPNINNTFINSTLRYNKDEFGNSARSFAIDRPFFSPFAKWAAGVSFSQQTRYDTVRAITLSPIFQQYKHNTQDYWTGYSTQVFKGKSENSRITNFITTVRFLRIRYLEKPTELFDPLNMYANENFYMASVGISTRKYVQDKFIFNFGQTEDVPIGKVYSFTGGYQIRNNIGRLYGGARVSWGNYYPWGYLSTNFEYSTFMRSSHFEQGVINVGINYFTWLLELGDWKLRQFIKPQVTIGLNRHSRDSISLNDGFGIDGFNSDILMGNSRLILTLQTQVYAPWNVLGFRFGPYVSFTLGKLGRANTGFKKSKLYSQIGLGVLIKNEKLVFKTFQLSLAFYPIIPGDGRNIFKANSLKSSDLGFRNFEIGKPATMQFQ